MRTMGKKLVYLMVLGMFGGGTLLGAPTSVEQATTSSSHRPHREREYFFLPPRSLYHFRPDLYVIQQIPFVYTPFHVWRPVVTVPHAATPRFLMGTRTPGAHRLILQTPGPSEVVRANFSDVVFDVVPGRARVYVNDKLIGSAGDFSSRKNRLVLNEGEHRLRLEFPGFRTYETVLEVHPNRTLHVTVELDPLE